MPPANRAAPKKSRLHEAASAGLRKGALKSAPVPTEDAFHRAAEAFAELQRSMQAMQPPLPSQQHSTQQHSAQQHGAAVLSQPPIPPSLPCPPSEAPLAAPPPPATADTAQKQHALSPAPSKISGCCPPSGCSAASDFSARSRYLSELGLTDLALEDSHSNPGPAIGDLRRTVRSLYDDTCSHIQAEQSSASAQVAKMHAELSELQRAFRHLAEVVVEELEELRADVER